MKNWKTTISGIFSLIIGGIGIATPIIHGQPADPNSTTQAVGLILAGIGLIAAKDSNVTGGTVQQNPPEVKK